MGKRKRKNSVSHIRSKIRRLQEKLRDAESESSSEEDYGYERYYNAQGTSQSLSPNSDCEVPMYDSDDSVPNLQIRSIVSPKAGPSNEDTITPDSGSNSLPKNPVPSTSAEVSPLSDDILDALGDPKGREERYGPQIPEEIAKRWGRVLTDGLSKEQKQEIQEKFLIPENFRLVKAPLLNPEIVPILSDAARNRDKQMEKYQNQLGLGISGLTGLAMNVIEGKTEKIELLKKISEVSQIFLDLHHEDTKRRRKLVTSSLDKKFLNMITDVKRDDYLFGINLGEKIKASKTAERSGLQIKRNETTSVFKKYPQQGNWRGPPRAQAARTNRQGGPRNRYPPQMSRRPPPTQDRPTRIPGKAIQATKTRKA